VRALAREVIHEFDTPARVIIVLTAAGAALGQWYLNNVVAGIAVGFALSLSINVIAMRRLAQVGGPDLLRPPADFDSAFDLLESLAIRERTRVGLVLTFAAALTLWLIPPVAPTSALILATGIALHFPALTAHRAPMRTTAVFVLWALGIITIAAAVAFRALAFFPELNSLTAREPVQAVVIAFLNTATLGLHEVLPGDGWFRVIALTHIALMAIAVGFWWIVSTLWRTRSDWKPNLESFNNDPVYQVIDVALVAAFAIVILKSSPGNVSTGWFVWTLLRPRSVSDVRRTPERPFDEMANPNLYQVRVYSAPLVRPRVLRREQLRPTHSWCRYPERDARRTTDPYPEPLPRLGIARNWGRAGHYALGRSNPPRCVARTTNAGHFCSLALRCGGLAKSGQDPFKRCRCAKGPGDFVHGQQFAPPWSLVGSRVRIRHHAGGSRRGWYLAAEA
jgi:hypothetical protein